MTKSVKGIYLYCHKNCQSLDVIADCLQFPDCSYLFRFRRNWTNFSRLIENWVTKSRDLRPSWTQWHNSIRQNSKPGSRRCHQQPSFKRNRNQWLRRQPSTRRVIISNWYSPAPIDGCRSSRRTIVATNVWRPLANANAVTDTGVILSATISERVIDVFWSLLPTIFHCFKHDILQLLLYCYSTCVDLYCMQVHKAVGATEIPLHRSICRT